MKETVIFFQELFVAHTFERYQIIKCFGNFTSFSIPKILPAQRAGMSAVNCLRHIYLQDVKYVNNFALNVLIYRQMQIAVTLVTTIDFFDYFRYIVYTSNSQ